jgi:hypothetical protein
VARVLPCALGKFQPSETSITLLRNPCFQDSLFLDVAKSFQVRIPRLTNSSIVTSFYTTRWIPHTLPI